MRVLLALAVTGALVVPGTIAVANQTHPKPDLRTSAVTASLSGSSVAVYATVKNKGKKKAPGSDASFYLSTDATYGAGDVLLGTTHVVKLKPKVYVIVYPTFTVPASVPAGSYRIVVCADSAAKIKETKDGNNCAASASPVTVGGSATPPPPPGTFNVTVTPTFGYVAISVNGDPPSTSSRTLNFPQGSQVVLTVTPQPPYMWSGNWTSRDSTCDGTVANATDGYAMTFSSLQHNVDCVANGHL